MTIKLTCMLKFTSIDLPLSQYTADLRDNEASQQVESTQLAAAEIERLVEDKQRLAEHLQQEVITSLALAHLPTLHAHVFLLLPFHTSSSSLIKCAFV